MLPALSEVAGVIRWCRLRPLGRRRDLLVLRAISQVAT
jgi:hypothetical protein